MTAISVGSLVLLAVGYVCASEIRKFDLKTIESLGRQLYEQVAPEEFVRGCATFSNVTELR